MGGEEGSSPEVEVAEGWKENPAKELRPGARSGHDGSEAHKAQCALWTWSQRHKQKPPAPPALTAVSTHSDSDPGPDASATEAALGGRGQGTEGPGACHALSAESF